MHKPLTKLLMTEFQKLATCHLDIVCGDNDSPFQWIFAIDDAWFHPSGIAVDDMKPVFPMELVGEKIKVGTERIVAQIRKLVQDPQAQNDDFSDPQNTQPLQPTNDNLVILSKSLYENTVNLNDSETANLLIEFVQDRYKEDNLDYGLCFCSFEYFLENIQRINQPQNAVFFDLRHQIAILNANLITEWTTRIQSWNLFSDQNYGNMERLGWMLHFAFKFSKISNTEVRSIWNNHILIISSAIGAKVRQSTSLDDEKDEERDAIGEFLSIQQDIWTALQDSSDELDAVMPSYFSWSPLPKNVSSDDKIFDTGLTIFNNSFKIAGRWDKIHEYFIHDILKVYQAPPAIAQYGHFTPEGLSGYRNHLKWSSWFAERLKDAFDALYITPDFNGYNACKGGKIFINTLLTIFSHSGLSEFPRACDDYDKWKVQLPFRPGFVFIYLFLDLVNGLSPKNGRARAKIDFGFDCPTSPQKFEIKIHLNNDGLKELQHCYRRGTKTNGDPCGDVTIALKLLGENKSQAKHKFSSSANLKELAKVNINHHDKFPIIRFTKNCLKIKLPASLDAPP